MSPVKRSSLSRSEPLAVNCTLYRAGASGATTAGRVIREFRTG